MVCKEGERGRIGGAVVAHNIITIQMCSLLAIRPVCTTANNKKTFNKLGIMPSF